MKDKIIKICTPVLIILVGVLIYWSPIFLKNEKEIIIVDNKYVYEGNNYIEGKGILSGETIIFKVSESMYEELEVGDEKGVSYEYHYLHGGKNAITVKYFY